MYGSPEYFCYRRVVEDLGTARDLYYTTDWQVIEERRGGTARVHNVWSTVYVDALTLRYRDSDNNGTLDERLYVLQDANFNVTAIVDTSVSVVERHVYDPYGAATYLTSNWGSRSASLYGWVYNHQGLRFVIDVGLIDSRARFLSPTLQRWLQQDPMWATNLYVAYGNAPVHMADPYGDTPDPQDHHWFPQFGQGRAREGQKRVDAVCCKEGIQIDIDDFTTTVDGFDTRSAHWWIHKFYNYNQMVKSIYDNARTCCELLTGVVSGIFITWSHLEALDRLGHIDPPLRQFNLHRWGNPGVPTGGLLVKHILDACGGGKAQKSDKHALGFVYREMWEKIGAQAEALHRAGLIIGLFSEPSGPTMSASPWRSSTRDEDEKAWRVRMEAFLLRLGEHRLSFQLRREAWGLGAVEADVDRVASRDRIPVFRHLLAGER